MDINFLEIIDNKNYNGQLEEIPVVRIMDMINNNINTDTIISFIKCDYGINKISRSFSYREKKLQTILDEMLFILETYHEYDDMDDRFDKISKFVILLIKNGAKCARDLDYNILIDDYNIDQYYNNKKDVILIHKDNINTYDYTFKYLSFDYSRFEYIKYLKKIDPEFINKNIEKYLEVIICDRHYYNTFDAEKIIKYYDNALGLNYKINNEFTFHEYLVNKNIMMMYQCTELYELYGRIMKLLSELHKQKALSNKINKYR